MALVCTRVWLIIYPYSPENGMAVSAVVYKHVKCDLCEVGGKKIEVVWNLKILLFFFSLLSC